MPTRKPEPEPMRHGDFARFADTNLVKAMNLTGRSPTNAAPLATVAVAQALLALYALLDERLPKGDA